MLMSVLMFPSNNVQFHYSNREHMLRQSEHYQLFPIEKTVSLAIGTLVLDDRKEFQAHIFTEILIK